MKKTVSILAIMAIMLSVFFCAPVFAADSSLLNRKTTSRTVSDVQVSVEGFQGYPYITTSLNGGSMQDTYFVVRIRNNSYTSAKYATGVGFIPHYSSTGILVQQDILYGDLTIDGVATDGERYIGQYNSPGGAIYLAPGQTLICNVRLTHRATFNINDQTLIGPALDYIVVDTFSAGDWNGDVPGYHDELKDIQNILENIATDHSFTGQLPNYIYNRETSSIAEGTYTQNSDFNYYVERSYQGCFPVTEVVDFETGNQVYSDAIFKHIYTYLIDITNNSSDDVLLDRSFSTSLSQSTDIIAMDLGEVYSTHNVTPQIYTSGSSRTLYLTMANEGQIFKPGHFKTVLYIYVYTKSTAIPTMQPAAANTGNQFPVVSNDLSDDSSTIANQSDQIHSQEAAYYQQNSAAIQATGLSNYQFDASAVSGLTGVRGDFIDVWNSLGGWNAVYIFSLTLGLALTILRHSPSAISSAIRRRNNKDA